VERSIRTLRRRERPIALLGGLTAFAAIMGTYLTSVLPGLERTLGPAPLQPAAAITAGFLAQGLTSLLCGPLVTRARAWRATIALMAVSVAGAASFLLAPNWATMTLFAFCMGVHPDIGANTPIVQDYAFRQARAAGVFTAVWIGMFPISAAVIVWAARAHGTRAGAATALAILCLTRFGQALYLRRFARESDVSARRALRAALRLLGDRSVRLRALIGAVPGYWLGIWWAGMRVDLGAVGQEAYMAVLAWALIPGILSIGFWVFLAERHPRMALVLASLGGLGTFAAGYAAHTADWRFGWSQNWAVEVLTTGAQVVIAGALTSAHVPEEPCLINAAKFFALAVGGVFVGTTVGRGVDHIPGAWNVWGVVAGVPFLVVAFALPLRPHGERGRHDAPRWLRGRLVWVTLPAAAVSCVWPWLPAGALARSAGLGVLARFGSGLPRMLLVLAGVLLALGASLIALARPCPRGRHLASARPR
jgi:hypothetical protein